MNPHHRPRVPTAAKLAMLGIGLCVALGVGTPVLFTLVAEDLPTAGQCLDVSSFHRHNFDHVECGRATYRVAVRHDNGTGACPSGDYWEMRDAGGHDGRGAYTLCLVLDAREGDCFDLDDRKAGKVACDLGAEYTVTRVLTRADGNGCDPGERAEVYAEPASTVCLAGRT